MRIRRTTSLQMETSARKPIKKQLSAVSVSLVIFLLWSVTFPTEILLRSSAVIIKRRLHMHESKLKEFFPVQFDYLQDETKNCIYFLFNIFIYLSITPTRNKEKNKEFFCLHLITYTSRKRMFYSFSTSYGSPKADNKAAVLLFSVKSLL